MNLMDLYNKFSPEQRAAAAQHLQSGLGGNAQTQVDANNPTAEQLSALHQEAQQKNPGLLSGLRDHPLLAGVLGGIGTYELDKHFGQK